MDDIKLAGKKHNIDPMWKVLNKEVDLGEPTSFLDHVYLGCTQRKCEINKDIVDNYRTMFESRISAGGVEKLPFPQNLRIPSWSYDMECHAKKCVERYCELSNVTTQQLYKVSTPCIDDHHFKEEEMKSVGELSNACSQIVLKCLYLAIIGRPDILWSVNKLARSITKWTKVCDKRLNRLISHIHHTREYEQYCHVGNTAKQCRLGLVSRLWLRGRSWRFEIHFWRNTAFLEVIWIRVQELKWSCTSTTSWSLARNKRCKICNRNCKLSTNSRRQSSKEQSRPKGRNLSGSYYSLTGVGSGVGGQREACSGTVEMHRHGDVQARDFVHDCRGLQGWRPEEDGGSAEGFAAGCRKTVSPRHRARSLHVTGPPGPQCSVLARREDAGTNWVQLGKVEAIVQIC